MLLWLVLKDWLLSDIIDFLEQMLSYGGGGGGGEEGWTE